MLLGQKNLPLGPGGPTGPKYNNRKRSYNL